MLNPFTEEEFAAMNITEYRMLPRRFWWDPLITLATARDWYNRLLPIWPGNWLTSFLPLLPLLPPNDCSKLVKIALMLKAAQELNKILHPFYHHSLQILYSRHWCSFILSIFHSQLLMQLTLLIPVLWRTHLWSSFQLNPKLPTFMHRHWKKIGRNIPSYSTIISFKIHQLHNLSEMCLDPYWTNSAWIITLTQTWEEIIFM